MEDDKDSMPYHVVNYCYSCMDSFNNADEYKLHLRSWVHTADYLNCYICGNAVDSQDTLHEHLQIHLEEKRAVQQDAVILEAADTSSGSGLGGDGSEDLSSDSGDFSGDPRGSGNSRGGRSCDSGGHISSCGSCGSGGPIRSCGSGVGEDISSSRSDSIGMGIGGRGVGEDLSSSRSDSIGMGIGGSGGAGEDLSSSYGEFARDSSAGRSCESIAGKSGCDSCGSGK